MMREQPDVICEPTLKCMTIPPEHPTHAQSMVPTVEERDAARHQEPRRRPNPRDGVASAPKGSQQEESQGTAMPQATAGGNRKGQTRRRQLYGKDDGEDCGEKRRNTGGKHRHKEAQDEITRTQMCECRCGRCLNHATKCLRGWSRGERPRRDARITRGSPEGTGPRVAAHASDGYEWNKTLYLCEGCYESEEYNRQAALHLRLSTRKRLKGPCPDEPPSDPQGPNSETAEMAARRQVDDWVNDRVVTGGFEKILRSEYNKGPQDPKSESMDAPLPSL